MTRDAPINDFLASLNTLIRQVVRTAVDPGVRRELVHAVVESASEILRSVTAAALEQVRGGLAELVEAAAEAVPPNWEPLTWPQITKVGELMTQTGWSLAWAPRADVLVEMLALSGDLPAMKDVLLRNEGQILSDLDELLARADHTRAAELRAAAADALESYRSGLFGPAQSHAAAALTGAMHDIGFKRPKDARHGLRAEFAPDKAGLSRFRMAAVLNALSTTLRGFDPNNPPRTFNRSASLHHAASPQHSQVNTLTAVMLLCSLTYEVSTVDVAALRAAPRAQP